MNSVAPRELGPILAALGLSLSHPVAAQTPEDAQPAVAWEAEYTVDALHVAEGEQTGTRVLGLASLSADLSLVRLVGWDGGRIGLHAIVSHGGHPNDLAGTLQGIDNIEVTEHHARLFEAYFEQEMLSGRASLRLGFSDLNSEFYATDSSALLLGPAYGIGSELSATGPNGPSIFPSSAPTARFRIQSRSGTYLQAAAVSSEAGVLGDVGGVRPLFDQGALLIGEAGHETATNSKFAIGAWTYTRRQEDLVETDPAGLPLLRRAWGVYALADLRIAGSTSRPFSLFARVGVSEGHTTPYTGGWQAGIFAQGVFKGRPDSQFSLGVNQAFLSRKFQLDAANNGLIVHGHETGIEVTYSDRIAPWLSVQPDLQLVWNGQHAPQGRKALILGIRLQFSKADRR